MVIEVGVCSTSTFLMFLVSVCFDFVSCLTISHIVLFVEVGLTPRVSKLPTPTDAPENAHNHPDKQSAHDACAMELELRPQADRHVHA